MNNSLNTPWARLSQQEKAELIGIYTRNGYNGLADIVNDYNEFANGGKIHIKESKKGTFTAAAKSRGIGVQQFASKVLANKDEYSPAMVKKANFARNAAQWHAEGGPVGNYLSDDDIANGVDDRAVYARQILKFATDNPKQFWADREDSSKARQWLINNAPDQLYALYNALDDNSFVDKRFIPNSVKQREYQEGVTNAINDAGKRIYDTADTVTSFMPGPVGTINWLSHIAADIANEGLKGLGRDVGMAAIMAGGLGAIGKSANKFGQYLSRYDNKFSKFVKESADLVSDVIDSNKYNTYNKLSNEDSKYLSYAQRNKNLSNKLARDINSIFKDSSATTIRTTEPIIKNVEYQDINMKDVNEIYNAIVKDSRIVDDNGNINNDNLAKYYKRVLKYLDDVGVESRDIDGINIHRNKNFNLKKEYSSSSGNTSLKEHIKGVVKTAQEIPVPKGSSRAELVRTALVHDIGKLITGQENVRVGAEHGEYGYELLKHGDDNFGEFGTESILNAVKSHMYDEQLGSSGYSFRHGIENGLNYDLLRALQAADVARGKSYDEAAILYPQLFTYARENPIKPTFIGTPEWQIEHSVKPYLKRTGYDMIQSADDVDSFNEYATQHRSLIRAVTDPIESKTQFRGKTKKLGDNSSLAEIQAMEHYGENSPINRMRASIEYVPLEPTGGFRAGLFKKRDSNGKTYYEPDIIASRLKIDPRTQDGIYVSTYPDFAYRYSGEGSGLAARATLPFAPMRYGETPSEFMQRVEWQLINGSAIASGGQPMSNWQMFEAPYRLQTGRSLQQDMTNKFISEGKKKMSWEPVEELARKYRDVGLHSDDTSKFQQIFDDPDSKLSDMFKRIGIDPYKSLYGDKPTDVFTVFDSDIDYSEKMKISKNAIKKLSRIANIFEKIDYNYDLASQINGIKFLKENNLITDKQHTLINKILRGYSKKLSDLQLLRSDLEVLKEHSNWTPIYTDEKYREKLHKYAKDPIGILKIDVEKSKLLNKRHEELEKYLFNDNLTWKIFKQAKNSGKKVLQLNPEYKKYINSPIKMAEFMRESGVLPIYDIPGFGENIVISTPGRNGFGFKPYLKNANLGGGAEGFIIGDNNKKVLDVTGQIRTRKDMQGDMTRALNIDGMKFTRKTFKTGGPLDLLKKAFAKNYDTETFSEAFAAARNDDRDYFKWNGNRYNTKLDTESFRESNPSNLKEGYAIQDAIRRIMQVENSKSDKRGGWDEINQRWYPHRSPEGGADTIAYGIKLSNGTQEAELAKKQGYLTDNQALDALDTLVQKYYDKAKSTYDKKFGDGSWDSLSEKSKSILTDYEYNPGLRKFPKLMEGFNEGDLDKIKANYKRYLGRRELGRNRYLSADIDSLATFYPIFK